MESNKASSPPGKLSVLVGKNFACVKIAGRANFMFSPDFKTLLTGLAQKGYRHYMIDLSECALMDSTFLGVLSGFGLKMTQLAGGPGGGSIELFNTNARVAELLEDLGAARLFKMNSGTLPLPAEAQAATPEPGAPSRAEIARTCLEAHQTLMAMNPDNVARFKDIAQFLAEDLKSLEKST